MLNDDEQDSNKDTSKEDEPKTDIKPPIYDILTEGADSSDVKKKDKEKVK